MERRLHIGGTQRAEGWEVLNIEPAPYVDHVGDAKNLRQFDDNTFSVVYASHVLEHIDYRLDVLPTLQEWNRVLVPGGKLCVSVPDLEMLASLLLLKERITIEDRYVIMRMIYGGHNTPNDFHYAGFTLEILTIFLLKANFTTIVRVDEFPYFQDTSRLSVKGVPISLNVESIKPLH